MNVILRTVVPVAEIFIHPDFDSNTLRNDIAVIKLSKFNTIRKCLLVEGLPVDPQFVVRFVEF